MGTHPIFESDFDCLTDMSNNKESVTMTSSMVSNDQGAIMNLPSESEDESRDEDEIEVDLETGSQPEPQPEVKPMETNQNFENNIPKSGSSPDNPLGNFAEIDKNDEVPLSFEYVSPTRKIGADCADFRDQDLLTDVTLVIGSDEFRAHKLLLATTIPYFNRMFYSGKIILHVDTVQDILQTANALGVYEVIQACSNFMSRHLTEQNVVQVWLLAQQINCKNLMLEAEKFCTRNITNFQAFANSSEFLHIPLEFLMKILEKDQFNVKSEEQVVKVVRRWVEADPERSLFISQILEVIRLGNLEIKSLLELEDWKPVAGNIAALRKISNAKNFHLEKLYENSHLDSKGPRNSYAGVLICVGGRGNRGDLYKSVEYLEAGENKEWKSLPDMLNARRHVGAVALDGCLYAVGGHSGSEHLASVECFDLKTKNWRLKRQMNVPRRGIALAVVNHKETKCIFAIGGLDDNMCYNNVEKYDPISDVWKQVADLRIHRGGVCAVTLNGEVYAIGGNDGVQSKACCEKYSPLLDKWENIPIMQQRRAGAGATVTNGKIFVAGGFDDNAPLASVEVYDPKNSTWTNIKQMMSPRGGVGLAPLSGNLVAVGGHNGSEYLKSVEIYSMTEDKWIQGPPTKRARAGSGIAWIQSDSDELEKEPAKPRLTAAVLRV